MAKRIFGFVGELVASGAFFACILLACYAFLYVQVTTRESAITTTALTYYNESIKNQSPSSSQFDQVRVSLVLGILDALSSFGVSPAEKANGIQDKSQVTLTCIYRDSPTAEWKDQEYLLQLEKQTDWKVVKIAKTK